MQKGILIKTAEESEIPFLAGLEKELFSDPWSASSLRGCIQNPRYQVWTAWQQEKNKAQAHPAGYLIVMRILDEGELLRIGCRKAAQRSGVADALLEHWFFECRRSGIGAVTLEVRSRNVPAISLYEKKGFRREGIRKDYYRVPLDDAILMWKRDI